LNKKRVGLILFVLLMLFMTFFPIIMAQYAKKSIVDENTDDTPCLSYVDEKYGPDFKIKVLNHGTNKVEEIDFEKYICGVMHAEMLASFEMEALKAQAVAARTYCLYRIEKHTVTHKDSDVCTDPSHCNAYKPIENATSQVQSRIITAVYGTRGKVVTYKGKLIDALYHSSSHQRTENAYNVWGNDVPYLRSVETPEEGRVNAIKTKCKDVFSTLSIPASVYASADIGNSFATYLNNTGRVDKISFFGVKYSGTKFRGSFGILSTKFTIEHDGDSFIITSYGYGHGVGMSQYGANEFAKQGYDYTEILLHYYTGTEIV